MFVNCQSDSDISSVGVWFQKRKQKEFTMSTPKAEKDLHLPLSRVKTIMKSSPDVEAVGPEPLYLVTKVTVSISFCIHNLNIWFKVYLQNLLFIHLNSPALLHEHWF